VCVCIARKKNSREPFQFERDAEKEKKKDSRLFLGFRVSSILFSWDRYYTGGKPHNNKNITNSSLSRSVDRSHIASGALSFSLSLCLSLSLSLRVFSFITRAHGYIYIYIHTRI
jgi:hypothetical protein